VLNDKGNITKNELAKRIKEIKATKNSLIDFDNKENDEETEKQELELLEKYQELVNKEDDLKSKIKETENILEKKVIAKYPELTSVEIKTLVVDLKWMTELENRILGKVDRQSQILADRVKELTERYGETLPEIEKETEILTQKVTEHLKKMGFEV
jgi:type I restriction enzyme M protein